VKSIVNDSRQPVERLIFLVNTRDKRTLLNLYLDILIEGRCAAPSLGILGPSEGRQSSAPL
jgi:hypothetical protein